MSLIWNFYFIKNEFDLLGQVSENTRFDTLIQESNFNDNPICKTEKETHMYRTDFWTLGEGEGEMFRENSIETCIFQG